MRKQKMRSRACVFTIFVLCMMFFNNICIAGPVEPQAEKSQNEGEQIPMRYIGSTFSGNKVLRVVLQEEGRESCVDSDDSLKLIDFNLEDIERSLNGIMSSSTHKNKISAYEIQALLSFNGYLVFYVSDSEKQTGTEKHFCVRATFSVDDEGNFSVGGTRVVLESGTVDKEGRVWSSFMDGREKISLLHNQPQLLPDEISVLCDDEDDEDEDEDEDEGDEDTSYKVEIKEILAAETNQDRPRAEAQKEDQKEARKVKGQSGGDRYCGWRSGAISPIEDVMSPVSSANELEEDLSDDSSHGSVGESSIPGKDGESSIPGKDGESSIPGKDREASIPGNDGISLILKNDGRSSSLRNDEKSSSLRNDEESSSLRNDEKSSSLRNDEKSSSLRNDEKSSSLRNDEKSSSLRNDVISSILKNDGRSSNQRNDGRSPNQRNDGRYSNQRNDGISSILKNPGRSSILKNDGRSRSPIMSNDEESSGLKNTRGKRTLSKKHHML